MANSIHMKPLDYFSAKDKAAREKSAREKAQAKQDAKYRASLSFEETQKAEIAAQKRANEIPTRKETEMRSALQATLASVFTQEQEDK